MSSPSPDKTRHICLAGRLLCNDWPLIQRLKAHHQVTLIERIRLLAHSTLLSTSDVLILDCSSPQESGLGVVPVVKRAHPKLIMILVDGGLTQKQIASAFRQGIHDYFSEPYETNLLVERLTSLLEKESRSS